MSKSQAGSVLLALFGIGCIVTSIARVSASGQDIATFTISAGFGVLALVLAGRTLLEMAARPSDPGGPHVQVTLLAIALVLAVIASS
jgi:hypothetical protein